MNLDTNAPISKNDCYQYLSDKLFPDTPIPEDTQQKEWPGKVGIELEMLALIEHATAEAGAKPDLLPLFPSEKKSKLSILGICQEIAEAQGWKPIYFSSGTHPKANTIEKFEINPIESITFEPGGQLEFSTRPFECLQGASAHLSQLQEILTVGFGQHGTSFLQIGLNPWYSPEEIGMQMQKFRYRAMDEYFMKYGAAGAQMMRQTMSIQVCLDYGHPKRDLSRRYIAANHLAPIAGAMFAYSPFVHGKISPYKSARIAAWAGLDSTRTGFPLPRDLGQKIPTREQIIAAYLDFALDAKVVYVQKRGYQVPVDLTFAQWMQGGFDETWPNLSDFINHLSLLFPEVRPKGFMEIRSTDCLPPVWQDLPAAFYLGLIYDERNLQWLMDYLPLGDYNHLRDIWGRSAFGLRDEDIKERASIFMKRSIEGLQRLPACFYSTQLIEKMHTFSEFFTLRGRTPADDLLEHFGEHGRLDLDLFKKVEKSWNSQ